MDFPATLIDRLRAGRIVPFAGAGVSRSVLAKTTGESLYPTWRELLDHAAEKLKQESKHEYATLVQSLLRIDKPNFLSAAEYAKNSLGPVWFDFLKEQFDHKREAATDESLSYARAIWSLGSKLVITTNYDRVLRWVCPNQVDMASWSIEAPAEQAAMVRGGLDRPVLWHLHGHIDDVANIILTPDSYERLYPSKNTQSSFAAGLETLRALIASRSFLFIGFSLEDEAFGLQLKAVSDVFAGATGPHYALIHADNIETVRNLNLPGIELIPFSDYGDPLLETLLTLSTEAKACPLEIKNPQQIAPISNVLPIRISIDESYDDICDTPPPTENWVGRNEELSLLRETKLKVVAVTGIGGQGKSSLVARFLQDNSDPEVFWDWRDCKEEANTLHTNLVRIIERITKGQRRASALSGESLDSVIRLFFNLSLSLRGLFVFDNIDQYVDVHKALAIEPMHTLIQGALKHAGRSRFIFTARPRLNYESPAFLQIELHGLSLDETSALFQCRGLISKPEQVREVQDLTQGHPLWINLIATQVLKNKVNIHDLVTRIKQGKEAGLPNAMLTEIWQTLNAKQRKLLRYLAELVHPETARQLRDYVSSDLSFGQFNKALQQLKTLDLVVVKSPQSAPDTIELHPLIREFVRRQFSVSERSHYISTIIVFLDRALISIRSSPDTEVSYAGLLNWIAKVELLINSGDCTQAIGALAEARRPMLRGGYAEEFVRLAVGALAIYEWNEAQSVNSKGYDDIVENLVDVLSQLGRFPEAEEYIRKFEQTVSGATARYVCLCNMRTYFYWLQEQFDLAKEWGRRGVELKANSHLDTRHDCAHNLALAQRDSGDIDSALTYFLRGAPLSAVVNPAEMEKGRGGSYFGNIGRTLYFKKDFSNSFVCLLKSASLLEGERDECVPLNQGWAAFWLGELLEKDGRLDISYICFRRAANKWAFSSPPRADRAAAAADRVAISLKQEAKTMEDWLIERHYQEWLSANSTWR